MGKRRVFTEEFKREAVRLVGSAGPTAMVVTGSMSFASSYEDFTVEGYFARVERLMQRDKPWLAEDLFEFHPELGYPIKIDINRTASDFENRLSYDVVDFVSLP